MRKEKQYLKGENNYPGKLFYIGDKPTAASIIEVISYNEDSFEEKQVNELLKLSTIIENNSANLIKIKGLSDISVIKEIGQIFNLHPLVLEDILNTELRPKIEEFDDYIFIVIKCIFYNEGKLQIEHVSMVLGQNYVLTFFEIDLPIFDIINNHIKNGLGLIRKEGNDYLAYSIVDSIIDQYYEITERIGDYTEKLEDSLVFEAIYKESIQDIQELKHRFIQLRRIIYPTKELVIKLLRSEHPHIKHKTKKYIADLFDHIVQITENLEIYREISWSLMEIYMAKVNNKMNEIMKVLTVMASIFIPLTFIAGVYGMNFKYMPELQWHYGYFFAIGLMSIIIVAMLVYFNRKKWL